MSNIGTGGSVNSTPLAASTRPRIVRPTFPLAPVTLRLRRLRRPSIPSASAPLARSCPHVAPRTGSLGLQEKEPSFNRATVKPGTLKHSSPSIAAEGVAAKAPHDPTADMRATGRRSSCTIVSEGRNLALNPDSIRRGNACFRPVRGRSRVPSVATAQRYSTRLDFPRCSNARSRFFNRGSSVPWGPAALQKAFDVERRALRPRPRRWAFCPHRSRASAAVAIGHPAEDRAASHDRESVGIPPVPAFSIQHWTANNANTGDGPNRPRRRIRRESQSACSAGITDSAELKRLADDAENGRPIRSARLITVHEPGETRRCRTNWSPVLAVQPASRRRRSSDLQHWILTPCQSSRRRARSARMWI